MRKDNSTLKKKLRQYSAVAGSLLAVTGIAKGQVVYTDIDPDEVLDAVNPFPGDSYNLDLNNDGINDFQLIAFKGSTYQGVGVEMYYQTGAIAGTTQMFGSRPFLYPYGLNLNDNIDANLPFFSFPQLSFSTSGGGNAFFVPGMATYYSGSGLAPNGKFGDGVDHYLALRFSDGTNTYYGWARCNVAEDASSVTVKDYAYNSTPDEGLFAGEGSPLGVPQINNPSFGIFGFEGVANVFIKDGNLSDAIITVTNMTGQRVVNQQVTDQLTRIDLNQFGKGMYLVTIQRGSEQFSRKVSFR